MPRVVFDDRLQQYTSVAHEIMVEVGTFRDAVDELLRRFPTIPRDVLEQYSVAIDGVVVHRPFLEQLGEQTELRFISPIRGG